MSLDASLEAEHGAARAARLLDRPGAWLAEAGAGYAVRLGPDGRRRPAMRLDGAVFAQLTREPGLAVRAEGGWRLVRGARPCPPDRSTAVSPRKRPAAGSGPPATPARGRSESALEWLARRKGPDGRPWLTAAERAAGERLQADWERSGTLGRLTMAWDAGPRSGGGRGPGSDPLEHGAAARARVRAALAAVGPELRGALEQVCLRGLGLADTEAALRLPRRTGKVQLKRALERLAAHYRLG